MCNHPTTLSIYIPTRKRSLRPLERLTRLSRTHHQPVNHFAIEAILQYLDREETHPEPATHAAESSRVSSYAAAASPAAGSTVP